MHQQPGQQAALYPIPVGVQHGAAPLRLRRLTWCALIQLGSELPLLFDFLVVSCRAKKFASRGSSSSEDDILPLVARQRLQLG